ncbi:MAG: hypothetical protein ABR884_00550 [Minisyncoccia bacterium]|jgi:hypothetical protein
MGKIKKRPTNIRTVGNEVNGKHSVSDEWPPVSYSGKYSLKSRVVTRVVEGEVYMEKYAPGRPPTTTVHRAGNAFVQDPDIYAVGSVYGAKTVSFSKRPIDPTFIPQLDEDI